MTNLDKLKSIFNYFGALEHQIKINNPIVTDGLEDFAGYVIDELEHQDRIDFDQISVEDFNKLSVNLFDSGLVVSIVEAEVDSTRVDLGFSLVDTWDDAEEETSLDVDISIDLATGAISLAARVVESDHEANELETIASIISLLGIQGDDVNLVIPEDETEISECCLVAMERLLYLVGESLIQFGTRWRKMIDPMTFEVFPESTEGCMPEFIGESSVILFGLFLVSEASMINESLMEDGEEDEDGEESGFGFLDEDERPIEERLKEAIAEAASNKTLH